MISLNIRLLFIILMPITGFAQTQSSASQELKPDEFFAIVKKYHPVMDVQEQKWNALGVKTKYYNTDLHKGSFAVPNYIKELLGYDG